MEASNDPPSNVQNANASALRQDMTNGQADGAKRKIRRMNCSTDVGVVQTARPPGKSNDVLDERSARSGKSASQDGSKAVKCNARPEYGTMQQWDGVRASSA